jgi:hypothetical protein
VPKGVKPLKTDCVNERARWINATPGIRIMYYRK